MMNREIASDSKHRRLVFLMGAPDQQYWEGLWRPLICRDSIIRGDRFVVDETTRMLNPVARVVDAGCGIGATVYGLTAAGINACGIDSAAGTIEVIKSIFPELQVQVGDVRDMPYPDCSLDGMWSLGVIEHFFDGYEDQIVEARRVLRSGGYLFLTVPSISPLKRLKLRFGRYRTFTPADRDCFFQFAFRKEEVVRRITGRGFRLLRSFGRSGSLGLSEDLVPLARFVLPSLSNTALWARLWWRLMDKVLTPFCYHTRYFLFQKIDLDVVGETLMQRTRR